MANLKNRLKKLEVRSINHIPVPLVIRNGETEAEKKTQYFKDNPGIVPEDCNFLVIKLNYIK